jgi:hypothetical protein
MRRFEIGPLIVALGSLVLLASLFMDWYGDQTAWDAFEVADVLLLALAVAALVTAAGLVASQATYLDRRWLPALAIGAAVLVVAELLSPPPAAGGADPQSGAWLAFAAVLVMLAGTVLSLGRVSFSFSIEGREPRHRVSAVDNRPPPTEAGAPVPRTGREETGATVALPDDESERTGNR